MKLFLHNILCCPQKGCSDDKGFPLNIEEATVNKLDALPSLEDRGAMEDLPERAQYAPAYNPEFIKAKRLAINYEVLLAAAKSLNMDLGLPTISTDADWEEESFLRGIHRIAFEFEIMEGDLVCPACKSLYKIKDGIPNLVTAY